MVSEVDLALPVDIELGLVVRPRVERRLQLAPEPFGADRTGCRVFVVLAPPVIYRAVQVGWIRSFFGHRVLPESSLGASVLFPGARRQRCGAWQCGDVAVTYQSTDVPSQEEALTLYDAVGWSAYTKDPARLASAISASFAVTTAREDGQLIGLARLVGDGLTIVYLQDILVSPQHQRRGIGRELLQQALAPYQEVRQKVLLTDDEPSQRAFYESVGFTEVGDFEPPLRAFVQLG